MSSVRYDWPKGMGVGWTLVGVASLWLILGSFLALFYGPANPLTPRSVPTLVAKSLPQLLPEGWGFFTKSQRDDYFEWYRRDRDGLRSAFDGPSSEPRNWLGLSRLTRAEGVEIGAAMAMSARYATNCIGTVDYCIASLRLNPVHVSNGASMPIFCGNYLLVSRPPVPYSWVGFAKVTMRSSITAVDITCP